MLEIDQAKQVFIRALRDYQAQCKLPEGFTEDKENNILINEPPIDKLFNWLRNKSGLDGYQNAANLISGIEKCQHNTQLFELAANAKSGFTLKKILIDCVLEVAQINGQHVNYKAQKLCKAKNHNLVVEQTEGNPMYYQLRDLIIPAKKDLYAMAISDKEKLDKFRVEADKIIMQHEYLHGRPKFT